MEHAIEFDVRPVVLRCMANRGLPDTRKHANVVAGDLEYGLIRMWMSMMDEGTDMELGLFRSRAEALEWIAP